MLLKTQECKVVSQSAVMAFAKNKVPKKKGSLFIANYMQVARHASGK